MAAAGAVGRRTGALLRHGDTECRCALFVASRANRVMAYSGWIHEVDQPKNVDYGVLASESPDFAALCVATRSSVAWCDSTALTAAAPSVTERNEKKKINFHDADAVR